MAPLGLATSDEAAPPETSTEHAPEHEVATLKVSKSDANKMADDQKEEKIDGDKQGIKFLHCCKTSKEK